VSATAAELYVRTLRRAAELDGIQALARRLKISPHTLLNYLEGKQPIPERVFLDAIDVLMEREEPRSASGRDSARPAGNR
jgi:hypothetical protein